jgi:hypothetical protein
MRALAILSASRHVLLAVRKVFTDSIEEMQRREADWQKSAQIDGLAGRKRLLPEVSGWWQTGQGGNMTADMARLSLGKFGFSQAYRGSPKASEAERIECPVAIDFVVGGDRLDAFRHATPRNARANHSKCSAER